MGKNYYDILGVDKSASQTDIKSAYFKLAKKYHPDVNKDPEAVGKFKEINEAYACLSDEQKRKNYDQFGNAEGSNFSDFFGGGSSGGFSGFSGDFGDIFGDIFSAFGGGSTRSRASRQQARGEDINLALNISLKESALASVF